jgi:SAM-dependent methyltransferase
MEENGERHWRKVVGGMWDEIGSLQFQYLVSKGLMPQHTLLDVGCGSLRGGVHFIRYLHPGNYFGMDKDQWLLDAGMEHELVKEEIDTRKPNLLCRDDFKFSSFETTFDYAIAQSVFTHLPWNSIHRCLHNMKLVLKPGGQFFATFFEDPDGSHWGTSIQHSPGLITTFPDKDPYHYHFSILEELGKRANLKAEYIGEWNHPRAQKIVSFINMQQPSQG